METARILARNGDLVPIAFAVLPETECGVISIWYSDSTDTPARSAVESTVAACSFELDFDRPGKIFAVEDNNFQQPNSLAYFYKISTIMDDPGFETREGQDFFLLLNVHSGSGAHKAPHSKGAVVFS
jgi:hypothetical protein